MTAQHDDPPLTPHERFLFNLCHRLERAFTRDPSVGAMNRAYRHLRTGRPEFDRELRDHIGLLYMFEEARPALLADDRKRSATGEAGSSTPVSRQGMSFESDSARSLGLEGAERLPSRRCLLPAESCHGADTGRTLGLQHSAVHGASDSPPMRKPTPSCRSRER